MATPIRGVLFDKDGTLFEFHATWSAWAQSMLLELALGDRAAAASLGVRIGFDVLDGTFDPASVIIAGTPGDIVQLLLPGVPHLTPLALEQKLNSAATLAQPVEVVPLAPFLAELRAMGLMLGVATNDAETPARAHLASVNQEGAFDFIAGYDSGYGGKPEPGMCLGFAKATGLDPAEVVMVGDSTHDLHAGRTAGMRTVAVLTGLAKEVDLAPLANVVLPDIGHLTDWIVAQTAQH